MKTIVKLAVLLATLLLLSGASFADSCYDLNYINLDNPTAGIFTGSASVGLDYGDNTGHACTDLWIGDLNLSLFIGLNLQALAYNDNCTGFFKFHGSDNNVVNGIITCYGYRFNIWAHKIEGPCAISCM